MNAQFGSEQAPLTAEQDRDVVVMLIAEMFGYPFEYVEGLPLSRIAQVLGLRDARSKIEKSKQLPR